MKKYLSWLILSLVAITFTSCEDEIDANVSGLLGSWEMVGTQDGAPLPGEDNVFTFYEDQGGVYECYNEHGEWESYPFEWEWESGFTYRDKIVYIYIGRETWQYYFYHDNGYLYLCDYADPQDYYSIYRPIF